ncbi:hypothetical protein F5883DRAFT_589501 [Diaporthe sp. PMI_573]|nr:hypothetical protein F5883DRAFT_589501 [Diaporthaceae sp. PMI_573]
MERWVSDGIEEGELPDRQATYVVGLNQGNIFDNGLARIVWRKKANLNINTALLSVSKLTQREIERPLYQSIAFQLVVQDQRMVCFAAKHQWFDANDKRVSQLPIAKISMLRLQVQSSSFRRCLTFKHWTEDRKQYGGDGAFLRGLSPGAQVHISVTRCLPNDSSDIDLRTRSSGIGKVPTDGSLSAIQRFLLRNLHRGIKAVWVDRVIPREGRYRRLERIKASELKQTADRIVKQGHRGAATEGGSPWR